MARQVFGDRCRPRYRRGLYCYTFEGELIWEKDFGDMDTGREMGEGVSLAGVKDRVNFLGQNGVTIVIRHGSEFQVLSKNTLDDEFDTSPLIVDDEIYLRGHQYRYCISR